MSANLLLLLVIGYFFVLMLIALIGKKQQGNEAFFLGNKSSPWLVVAIGMIGASLSGVSFISVPGWVFSSGFSYLQLVIGFSLGYIVVAKVLLPVYYKLELTSIYEYLLHRFGKATYKTGTLIFILSRTIGGATRLFIVALILQTFIFTPLGVPFIATVAILLILIYLYTFVNGIKTIVWTDALQTIFLLVALLLLIYQSMQTLSFSISDTIDAIRNNSLSKIWVTDNWKSPSYFVKMVVSGMFITIAMTGLDQDMMQKNLSCKNLKSAQKNMLSYGFAFIPMNILFLVLGLLLILISQEKNILLPMHTDSILPSLVANGWLGKPAIFFLIIGIVAATFSSADSALVSLTTAFSVDIINIKRLKKNQAVWVRRLVHLAFCIVFLFLIMLFLWINNKNILDLLFTIASYTYGPLLGIFAYGIFTKKQLYEHWVPVIAILSPIISYIIQKMSGIYFNYYIGYELLIINGIITFVGLIIITKKNNLVEPNIDTL